MRLGFDAKRLFNNYTGLGNYSRTLIQNLVTAFPGNEYHLFSPKIIRNKSTNFFLNHESVYTHTASSGIKEHWRSYRITKDIIKEKIELYHGLSHELPMNIHYSHQKTVVTIHDLIFKVHPETYPIIDRKIYDLKFKYSCEKADKIIAISEHTKKDIINLYGIPEEKIEVIYQSCAPVYYEEERQDQIGSVLKKYNLPSTFLLYVGSVSKRKNLEVVINALKHLNLAKDIPLVVIGKGKSYFKKMKQLVRELDIRNSIFWIDNLSQSWELKPIYKHALALVYPSIYEGFGLPVLEAILCKCPVITSPLSSLPEAGGPYSIYVDPHDPVKMATSIDKLAGDSAYRKEIMDKSYLYGREKFNPQVLTKQIMDVYSRIVED